jgi:DNA-binding MarR family transcriptional regulator
MDNKILQESLKLINKYNSIDKKARNYGTNHLLYPSEIHVIDAIGMNEEVTTTKIAEILGITKGGVSQITKKLIDKNLIQKRDGKGINEVYLSLTEEGITAYHGHSKLHEHMLAKMNKLLDEMDDTTKEAINNFFIELNNELSILEGKE